MIEQKIIKRCEKHGYVVHGVYSYGNERHIICLECTRENRRKRQLNPLKYLHDKEYTKNWIENNKERYRELEKIRYANIRNQHIIKVGKFIDDKKNDIIDILMKLESDLSLTDIKKHCIRYDITSLNKIINYIKYNKRSKLMDKECWKKSSLIKYYHGIRESYSLQPEEIKEEIRKEYKKVARKKVNKKMKKLYKNIKEYGHN